MSSTPPDQTFDKILVNAPPGKLGIHMVDLDSGGSKVSAVNNDSVLAGRVLPGDVLAKINEVDCSEMNTTGSYILSRHQFVDFAFSSLCKYHLLLI